MKATLAFVACLLTAGFLTAAEVTGNNTAVVIRKDVVKSSNGYQFLCVPVNGLDIANGATPQSVSLNTLLPAELLDEGTSVIIDSKTYIVKPLNGVKKWTIQNQETQEVREAQVSLAGGTTFWLSDPPAELPPAGEGETEQEAAELAAFFGGIVPKTAPATIIFCGQNRDRVAPTTLLEGVQTLKNDSATAISPAEAIDFPPENNDQILLIKAGAKDYTILTYRGGAWWGPGIRQDVTDNKMIAPGEAFYYYNKTAN